MRGIGLLTLALALAAPALAADQSHSVTSPGSEGQTIISSTHKYANTGADAATSREKGTPPEVGPGKAGGYLAAGIGVAALGGLFMSRKQRTRGLPPRNPRGGPGGPGGA